MREFRHEIHLLHRLTITQVNSRSGSMSIADSQYGYVPHEYVVVLFIALFGLSTIGPVLCPSVAKNIYHPLHLQSHTLGLGPDVVDGKIKSYFGNGDDRFQRLENLRASPVPPKLEKQCMKLEKYSLPTESANVQCQAFKAVVNLVTLFPGLRLLFVRTEYLDGAISVDALSALWEPSTGYSNEEWSFWKDLAATCLTDTTISAAVERSSIPDLCNCNEEASA
ncbi:hypothetical protein B0H13DRAFT_1866413 [Mycena leptocephala]|nr:hypothetical protein B0H13DRAFT_1866413 [Mycena leptocephala]